jgi:hypothetical protein
LEIFKIFISSHPENVPKTPYLSVLIAFATSFAVTKLIYLFFQQEAKIAKYSIFMIFLNQSLSIFTTFGFHNRKKLVDDYKKNLFGKAILV